MYEALIWFERCGLLDKSEDAAGIGGESADDVLCELLDWIHSSRTTKLELVVSFVRSVGLDPQ